MTARPTSGHDRRQPRLHLHDWYRRIQGQRVGDKAAGVAQPGRQVPQPGHRAGQRQDSSVSTVDQPHVGRRQTRQIHQPRSRWENPPG